MSWHPSIAPFLAASFVRNLCLPGNNELCFVALTQVLFLFDSQTHTHTLAHTQAAAGQEERQRRIAERIRMREEKKKAAEEDVEERRTTLLSTIKEKVQALCS